MMMRLAFIHKERRVGLLDRKNGLTEFLIFLPLMNRELMLPLSQKIVTLRLGY